MSWQQYVDTQLVATGKVTKAVIADHAGNPWACSPGFAPTQAELAVVAAGFANPASLQASGIKVGGTKYMFVRDLPNNILGRKGGDSGIAIYKTGKCIIVGIYENGIQGGECNNVVCKLGDYLCSVGY
jgi:profilin